MKTGRQGMVFMHEISEETKTYEEENCNKENAMSGKEKKILPSEIIYTSS